MIVLAKWLHVYYVILNFILIIISVRNEYNLVLIIVWVCQMLKITARFVWKDFSQIKMDQSV